MHRNFYAFSFSNTSFKEEFDYVNGYPLQYTVHDTDCRASCCNNVQMEISAFTLKYFASETDNRFCIRDKLHIKSKS